MIRRSLDAPVHCDQPQTTNDRPSNQHNVSRVYSEPGILLDMEAPPSWDGTSRPVEIGTWRDAPPLQIPGILGLHRLEIPDRSNWCTANMNVLLVDLNNFSRYPTMSIGYLTAILRKNGIGVTVFCPLANGVTGYPRVTRAAKWGLIDARVRYWSATTSNNSIRQYRRKLAKIIQPGNPEDSRRIIREISTLLDSNVDAILISTYTMYRNICEQICEEAKSRGVPSLIGGSYFNHNEIIDDWLEIEGLSALSGGEPERYVSSLVRDLVSGSNVSKYPGISVRGWPDYLPAPPLDELDEVPFPDYSDFPWSAYPNRIIPMMTGRGCAWGACTFCSDVKTSSGRTFRSRSIQNVFGEMEFQAARHSTRLFTFLDLKLNSDLEVWKALCAGANKCVPNCKWTASVHVDDREDNGLGHGDLENACDNGLVRITTGLESGSASILDKMAKGTSLARISDFLKLSGRLGISVRLTAITGYPGERPSDVDRTRQFLEDHFDDIERVVLNRFSVMVGTTFAEQIKRDPDRFPGFSVGETNTEAAQIEFLNKDVATKQHRQAVFRLLETIHAINRKSLSQNAQDFEGVM